MRCFWVEHKCWLTLSEIIIATWMACPLGRQFSATNSCFLHFHDYLRECSSWKAECGWMGDGDMAGLSFRRKQLPAGPHAASVLAHFCNPLLHRCVNYTARVNWASRCRHPTTWIMWLSRYPASGMKRWLSHPSLDRF